VLHSLSHKLARQDSQGRKGNAMAAQSKSERLISHEGDSKNTHYKKFNRFRLLTMRGSTPERGKFSFD
jgi:hypothetical protein